MKFSDYVKKNYDSTRHLPPRERLGALAKEYKKMKPVKGGDAVMDFVGQKMDDFVDQTKAAGEDLVKDIRSDPMKYLKMLGVGGGQLKMKKKRVAKKRVAKKRGGALDPQSGRARGDEDEKQPEDPQGGGLLTDALGMVGLPGPMSLFGGDVDMMSKRRGKNIIEKEPLNLLPPSVPISRAYNRNIGVPGPLKFTENSFNPHAEAIKMRQMQESAMRQNPGMLMPAFDDEEKPVRRTRRARGGAFGDDFLDSLKDKVDAQKMFRAGGLEEGGSMFSNFEDQMRLGIGGALNDKDTSGGTLKQILKKHKIPVPKGMRDKKPGSKISKKDLLRVYDSAVSKHGKEKAIRGGGWFDDFSSGFKLPFQAIASIL